MEEKSTQTIPKYFAAANTYHGFLSLFDEVFSSSDYDRIYVLKGGPGTGKSSFMKKLSSYFQMKSCNVEEIYCSSDPNSLDGVIISLNNKKIAVLDGTAPHERDAIIPGAIDEIINLGNGWDTRVLCAQRNEILSLVKEKGESYKTAYNYLSIAGKAYDKIYNLHKKGFDIIKAKIKAESLLKDFSSEKSGMITRRLISSFGKHGSHRLDMLSVADFKKIEISGNEISCRLFLDCCLYYLKEKSNNLIHLLCALDPSSTDGIILPDYRVFITQGDSGEINAEEFISISPADSERIRAAYRIHTEALDEARRWFVIASDLHFRLEEIYGRAMNFANNDDAFDKKTKEIENILEII